nr:cysteine-rich receptor-like protein kinase 25 [Quercus suber]
MLRYSDVNFFGQTQISPMSLMYNTQNTTSPELNNFYALGLLYDLIDRAKVTDMLFKSDSQTVKLSDGSKISYGLVQCTRDIDGPSCGQCLSYLMDTAETCCQAKIGWRILGPSCFLRYENYSFTEQSPAKPLPLPPTVNDGIISQEISLPNNLAGSFSIELMDSSIYGNDNNNRGEIYYFNLITILAATNNFSDANKLGEGGFGPVYKVWQLWNEGKGVELIDQTIIDTCPISEALRLIHIALLCVQEDPNDRPTMSRVILMLASKSINLPEQSAPPFSVGRLIIFDQSSTIGTRTGLGLVTSDQSSTSASSY